DLSRSSSTRDSVFRADDYSFRVNRIDYAVALGNDDRARILRRYALHAGSDERRFRAQQRDRLALHVRSHQRAVGVVVLKKRNQRRGDRNQLLRADVDELDLIARRRFELPRLSRGGPLLNYAVLLIDLDRSLPDRVAIFFPGRQVKRIRFEFGWLMTFRRQFPVFAVD